MLAEPIVPGSTTYAVASSAVSNVSSSSPGPDSLHRLVHALDALRGLAEQRGRVTSVARADASVALSCVDAALEEFLEELEQELEDRRPARNRLSALVVNHVRRCAERQRAEVARVRAQVEGTEGSLRHALQAALTLTLVMRVEVAQLARDVRL